jgi:hypothetical protein
MRIHQCEFSNPVLYYNQRHEFHQSNAKFTNSTSKHEIHSENSQREALANCSEQGYNRLASFQLCLGQGS